MPLNTALDTALTILEVLRAIPRKRFTTAVQVCHSLEVGGHPRSLRSVQRLLDQIEGSFPIECDRRGKPFGYRWRQDAQGFHLPLLSPAEAVLLRLAESQARDLLPHNLKIQVEPLLTAARSQIQRDSPQALHRRWLGKVRRIPNTQPLLPPNIPTEVFDAVSDALYHERKLSVVYHNAHGKQQEAVVWPLGLALQEPRLYLVCRFEGYDNERILALSRIEKATALNASFPYPKDFQLERYDGEGRFAFGEGKLVRLRMRIELAAGWHLTESRLSKDQTWALHGDDLVIEATVVDSLLLQSWLRGLGPVVHEWTIEPVDDMT
jgi:predicted DNA-binding transcriptional regulator YafY